MVSMVVSRCRRRLNSPRRRPIRNYLFPATRQISAWTISKKLFQLMNDKKVDPRSILQSILGQGILPLFYWESPAVCLKVMQTLYKAGVRAVEYTNRGVAALDNFSMLKKALAMEAPDLYLGIGTVKSKKEAEAFVAAGGGVFLAPIVYPPAGAAGGGRGGSLVV